jgi:hypothetical protein
VKYVRRLIQLAVLAVLLFFLFVRFSVWMYQSFEAGPWLSVASGAAVSALFLTLCLTIIYKWMAGRVGSLKVFKWRAYLSLMLVLSFCFYSLIFLSENNAKGKPVVAEFRSLHPVLRVGVSTTILADRSLLITDASRTPEDYDGMALGRNPGSLHYPQADGFVHAVDIRTNGRSENRNRLLQLTFRLMGFRTLRHVGTSDHLHIALP